MASIWITNRATSTGQKRFDVRMETKSAGKTLRVHLGTFHTHEDADTRRSVARRLLAQGRIPDRAFFEPGKVVKKRMTRPGVSPKVRFDVLERDGFACRYCGRTAPDVVLQVDHVLPVALGGKNKADNLTTACHECNAGKRDRQLVDYGTGWTA